MNILVLGGTGAMGTHLIDFLSENKDVNVTVTSRKERTSHGNIHYIVGNARDWAFMSDLLKNTHYDVIIDFMNYNYEEFLEYHGSLLAACDHYIFLSSSRVYANYDGRITEDCPRLLETSDDEAFLATNRYALRKAREEDMLRSSGMTNYSIIRPYITYSNRRLQLGIYEKEEWLYRVLNGKNIILYTSHEIGSVEMLYEGGYNTVYDRQWNCRFDNTKAEKVCRHISYLGMREGLSSCLKEFLSDWKAGGMSCS